MKFFILYNTIYTCMYISLTVYERTILQLWRNLSDIWRSIKPINSGIKNYIMAIHQLTCFNGWWSKKYKVFIIKDILLCFRRHRAISRIWGDQSGGRTSSGSMGGRHRRSVFYKKTHNSLDGLRQERIINQNIKVTNEL